LEIRKITKERNYELRKEWVEGRAVEINCELERKIDVKKTKYSWILVFPGFWRTKEGFELSRIFDRPGRYGHSWYKFRHHEFEVRGSFEAQLKAEELIESDLETFKKALDNMA